ncbi:hypothetical protein GGTG_06125 [Gaeumannomyces tritici R3-111a-1]|uniref:Uncharacterized protein n=1 Tax=Gaeumannomyces tritici (strain R3-111a-1) TaxID=644352 RepID=J3NXX0_GAET3|nr:hypothetical protein GGTG_06125 [Gaeumannomyces tritici R3-111a-1]EJT76203.1 hypothetical protein GGTG_06125 [Gaeumannomyces tritici R3-111a-1]
MAAVRSIVASLSSAIRVPQTLCHQRQRCRSANLTPARPSGGNRQIALILILVI